MEYHRITQSREGKDVLQPISLTVSEIWGEERPLFVPGREGKAGRQVPALRLWQRGPEADPGLLLPDAQAAGLHPPGYPV